MRASHLVRADVVYFALVFGAGFVLGTIRVLWLVPQVGTRIAELLEAPIMFGVIILSARWVTRHFSVPTTASSRLGMGGIALAPILLLDFTVVLWIRGLSFRQYIEEFDPVAGTAYFVMLGVFAVMPLLVTRCGRSGGLMLWLPVLLFLAADQALAEETTEKKASVALDCRYEQAREGTTNSAFPKDDVFRPLMADPKQPQFFASWQAVRARTDRTSANVGSVGFGENFGFYTRRDGCNGWQLGVLAGVLAQFNLDAPSKDLINADYVVGIPLSWRSGGWSTRVRLYHQSSHLGDEFLLGRPGFDRVNLSFEEVEAILSYDYRWARLYAGGGYLVHREPATLDRSRVQWGFELRGPTMDSPILGTVLPGLRITPVLGTDFKSFEELKWIINTNVIGGIEWSMEGSTRRFRVLLNYYHGFNPYGQFFAQRIETVGFGLYLAL